MAATAPFRFVRDEKTTANAEEREGTANAEGAKESVPPWLEEGQKRRAKASMGWRVTSHPSQNARWMGHPVCCGLSRCGWVYDGSSVGGMVRRWSEFVEGFGVGVEDHVG